MFNVTEYILEVPNGNTYVLIDAFFIPTDIHIFEISRKNVRIQIVVNKTSAYISHTEGSYKDANILYVVLYSYLVQKDYETPIAFINIQHVSLKEQLTKKYTIQNIVYYKSSKHIFKVTIKKEPNHIFIKVGGQFDKCVELFIYTNKNKNPYIAQIYSEPECGYDTFLEQGESIDMLKSALQVCQTLFGVAQFELKDASNIECAKEMNVNRMKRPPPRKLKSPMSLAHISIINNSKTWYERHFNAHLANEQDELQYKRGLEILNESITISYEDFSTKVSLTYKQNSELKSYYESANTWIQFLRSVPKERQCELFPWVPSFLDELMKFKVNESKWIIELGNMYEISNPSVDQLISHEPMIRTDVLFLFKPPSPKLWEGGRHARYTRKYRQPKKYTQKNKVRIVRMYNSGTQHTVL